MRCVPNGGVDGGEDSQETEVISVIAGDMYFREPVEGDSARASDYQTEAFTAAMRLIAEIREEGRQSLGNALFMFDQKGPWDKFFTDLSRRKKKKGALRLNNLKRVYSSSILDVLAEVGLPANFSEILEVIPEEKLKFLFLKFVEKRALPLDLLLELSLIISKAHAPLRRGESSLGGGHSRSDLLTFDDEDEDEEATDPSEFENVSCSIEPVAGKSQVIHGTTYSDYLARCRAVAATLTYRAGNLEDLTSADRIEAFYQFDPADPNRVNAMVVTDGASFAQKHLGVDAMVRTHFFVPKDDGSFVTVYETVNGETKKIESGERLRLKK